MLDCMHPEQWLFFPRDWTIALYMLPELGPSVRDLLSAGFVRPLDVKTDLSTCSWAGRARHSNPFSAGL